jgi:hypothetical protein
LPHTSRLPKAFAGDGPDANVCADVYDLYVKYIVKRALSLLATHLPFVESGSPDNQSGKAYRYMPVSIRQGIYNKMQLMPQMQNYLNLCLLPVEPIGPNCSLQPSRPPLACAGFVGQKRKKKVLSFIMQMVASSFV